MKNLYLLLLIIPFFITSCSDDNNKNNSHTEFSTTSFAYVSRSENGTVFAKTPSFYITSDKIAEELNVTDCAIISYKVVNHHSGINQAQNVSIQKLAYKGYLRPTPPTVLGDEIYPTEFDYDKTYGTYNYGYYSLEDFFEDNWLFSIKFDYQEDTKVDAIFYYDANSQQIVDAHGIINPKDNEIIIDVRFEKGTASSGFTTSAYGNSTYFVGNMSEIRQILSGSNYPKATSKDTDEYISVPVKFRFKMKKKNVDGTDAIKESILGSWEDSYPSYKFFSFPKDQD